MGCARPSTAEGAIGHQKGKTVTVAASLVRWRIYGHDQPLDAISTRSNTSGGRDNTRMGILSEIFVWWGGNSWGNRWDVWRQGTKVGEDAEGNRYYVQGNGARPNGIQRRWVVYKHAAEASKIPPEWHGWMHHTVDTPPTEQTYQAKPWQKPHRENMTGTVEAYRPAGSLLASGKRAASASDYEPWKPE